jgi:hypothetical protein
MSRTKLSLGGNNLYKTSLFPPRESLVSEIPAGDGNIEKLFYGVELRGQFFRPILYQLISVRNFFVRRKDFLAIEDNSLYLQLELQVHLTQIFD